MQLLSAGTVLEDVLLHDLPSITELLAALKPAAGTLKVLWIHRRNSVDDVQVIKDMEVSRILSAIHNMADRPGH